MKQYIDINGNKHGIITGGVGQLELIQSNWVECNTKADGTFYAFYNADGTVDMVKEAEQDAKDLFDTRWKTVDEYMSTLEVTSDVSLGGNKFNVSPEGIINIQNKIRTMLSTDTKYWVESWASFDTNIVEMEWVLKETERLRDLKIIEVGL